MDHEKIESAEPQRLDMAAIRAKLADLKGPSYWRGLEELAETDDFKAWLDDEFPNRASLPHIDRRDFLKFMGASLALAGVSGCRFMPQAKIVPYVRQPEEMTVGIPLEFATAAPFFGFGRGVIARSNMGRPTKIEGNPGHPANAIPNDPLKHGGTDLFMQASLLNLYDPDRVQNVLQNQDIAAYEDFLKEARAAITAPAAPGTAPVRILSETITSPTLVAQIEALLAANPGVRWHTYEPAAFENTRAGARLAFGTDADTIYHFDRATNILSLDSDFLLLMPGSVRYAREYGEARRVHAEPLMPHQPAKTTMCRLYAVESAPTLTGANADHRLSLPPSQIEGFARALAQQLGVDAGGAAVPPATGADKWIATLATELRNPGSVVVVGETAPPVVHAIAHAINAKIGAVGTTVTYIAPVAALPPQEAATAAGAAGTVPGFADSLKALVADMQAGQVKALLILGGNPVYTAPVDVPFAAALKNVPLRAHLATHNDETAQVCNWVVPEAHYLEAWSDIRAFDGTASVVQPLIAPLYEAHSAHELISALFATPDTGYNLVRRYWQGRGLAGATGFDKAWERWLNDGVVPEPARPAVAPTVRPAALAPTAPAPAPTPNAIEVCFRLDPTVLDGRYSNNPWLQEMVKPLYKLQWDNAAYISPALAERLKLTINNIVTLKYRGQEVRAPIWVQPGHPDNTVTLHLGYGRARGVGRIGEEIGFNAGALRTSDAPYNGAGIEIGPIVGDYRLVTSQSHNTMHDDLINREPVRIATLPQYLANPSYAPEMEETPEEAAAPDIFHKPPDYEDWGTGVHENKWGMAIDLSVCIGCNACSMACQAENNIPVVGKAEVAMGRWMNWIRVDRYYEGKGTQALDNPTVYFQPVPCMHCEKAPCEPVCPVGATLHSHEGLNQMVYNRCVGTRYCSNNCPYKVRRFNFYKYSAGQPNMIDGNYDIPVMQLSANPNVTVRGRGVMEKCSYCVQRINAARIVAKEANDGAGRDIRDHEIITACQQACPTHAITFGDIRRKANEVARWKAQPQNYSLLAELNTVPRTTYLGKVINPNPALVTGAEEA